MIEVQTQSQVKAFINKAKANGKTIGFVPTMGFLHDGHLRLVKEARKDNDVVVMSIFVNPLQFGPNEDFDCYPRNYERDSQLAKESGVDLLFYPSIEEIYPDSPSIQVVVKDRVDVLCGKSRPGHFDGVATVVAKLFNIVECHRAYFGMKDAQQVAVIEGLIQDLNFPVKLVPVEIVREKDGLAKSSRNVNLQKHERDEASALYESLKLGEQLIISKGERNSSVIINEISSYIERKTSGQIDYIEIYSYPHLKSLNRIHGKIIIALAVQFTNARLIDNITMSV